MPLHLLVLCVPAFLVAAAGLLAGFVFLGSLRLPRVQRCGAATLILPLTGEAAGLGDLLRAIEAQSLAPRRLLICLESRDDPAHARATRLAGETTLPIEIVIAGEASHCAQKCRNQIAGLQRIDAADQVVILLDADIAPPRWWLSALATPILDGSADVVTGYRWPTIDGGAFAAHLAAAIDRGIALLPRLAGFQVTWGGSLALSPAALARLGAGRVLADTLSDDCTIGAQAATLGLRVLTRRALLVPTPANGGVAAVWRFGRRQYQIIRVYRPGLWWLALLAVSARLLAWAILLAQLEQWWARLALLGLLACALLATLLQTLVGRRLGFAEPLAVTLGQAALCLFRPLVDAFHWSLVVAAADARRIRWGHITYRVTGPAQIAIASRRRWP